MKLSDEALDAAVVAYLAHDDTIRVHDLFCDCGENFLAAGVDHEEASRLHLRHRMQAVADALTPYIIDRRDGQ